MTARPIRRGFTPNIVYDLWREFTAPYSTESEARAPLITVRCDLRVDIDMGGLSRRLPFGIERSRDTFGAFVPDTVRND
jgi:hypothetical protein